MISIIIPLFNQAGKISRTFDSIIGQDEKQLEVIVVNDGSSDNASEVCGMEAAKFAKAGIGFKFIEQKENKGAPAARNRGLAEANGDFLFFCDADSFLEPSALTKLKNTLLEHPEASYAYSSFMWGNKLFKVGAFDQERLKKGPMIHTMALIRATAMTPKKWDESIRKLQDWDLWLTMLEEGKNGVWVDEVLFSIQPGGVYSNWVPSFVYKLLPWLPVVKKYNKALAIVKAKHKLA
ncbi:glycosyltransferase family 2 protein [Candidatus Falkowbacteria bacterium]|nr:glycosyltransferase family 2 protein [Candidatus Falkowbacteria bacterium]